MLMRVRGARQKESSYHGKRRRHAGAFVHAPLWRGPVAHLLAAVRTLHALLLGGRLAREHALMLWRERGRGRRPRAHARQVDRRRAAHSIAVCPRPACMDRGAHIGARSCAAQRKGTGWGREFCEAREADHGPAAGKLPLSADEDAPPAVPPSGGLRGARGAGSPMSVAISLRPALATISAKSALSSENARLSPIAAARRAAAPRPEGSAQRGTSGE